MGKPELVIEVQYAAWSGAGRLSHAVILGRRDDKPASDVVRAIPDEAAKRMSMSKPTQTTRPSAIVEARAPGRRGAALSHADRELWPGITKQALADYWQHVATIALPGIAHRPLAILRCPDGIDGQRFFQKHGHKGLPAAIREGAAGGQPYLALDDTDGLLAMAQVAAIELHAWGASEDDPLHPDRIVFDLDPGEGVAFAAVVQAAKDVRARLERLDLDAFCRTTGGNGLHVVAPLTPEADWDTVRDFCRGFAERMAEEERDRFVARVPKAERRGRILVDWLRNGLGATAVASFSPRARPGATVATPLAWREVTAKLDPSAFTLNSVPQRLRRQKRDPWEGFATARQKLPPMEKPNRRGGNG